MSSEVNYRFKVTLVGDSTVGKTSIVERFLSDSFSERKDCTVGVDFVSKTMEVNGEAVRLQIWDTAGQERFRSLLPSYLRDAQGIMVVYDVTDAESFNRVQMWVEEAKQNANLDAKLLLIGNKSDLAAKRAVDQSTGKALADKHGIAFTETSAKDTTNVKQAFVMMAAELKSQAGAGRSGGDGQKDASEVPESNPASGAEQRNQLGESNPVSPGSDQSSGVTRELRNAKCKLVLAGDSTVGKTSVIERFIFDSFSESTNCTIGIDFMSKTIEVNGEAIRLQIWDTAGQERFRSLLPSYFRDAQGVMIVYDVTDAESFSHAQMWLEEAKENANPDIKLLLIGNKSDLAEKRMVDFSTGKALADKLGIPFIETSAKDMTNVKQAFLMMTSNIIGTTNPAAEPANANSGDQVSGIKIDDSKPTNRKPSKTC